MPATETQTDPWIEDGLPEKGVDANNLYTSDEFNDSHEWDIDHQSSTGWSFGGGSISKADLTEFTSQLAIMTRSGVDVASALGSLAKQCNREALAEVLSDIHELVLAGSPLSSALRQHSKVFEPSFIATVAAGEASGRMSDVLRQLAAVQRGELRSSRTLRALATYPILLFVVSSSVLVALVLLVLPKFSDIFQEYELALPAITEILLSIAGELQQRWWLWIPAAVASVAGFFVWRSTSGGRRTLDSIWLNMPIVSGVYRSSMIGRLCRMFGLMLESGVPLLEVLKLSRNAVYNVFYREIVEDMEDAVLNGRSLASVLHSTDILPGTAREMLITAESTGNLGEVTRMLGEYYEEETEARMRQVVGVLEPLITVVMGVLVAIVVLAVMLPVFDLSTIGSR